MRYLQNYGEYLELGGTFDEATYSHNIIRVEAQIDNATFNRVAKMQEVPLNAKILCRDLLEYMTKNVVSDIPSVTSRSQSAGAVSESESYATKTHQDFDTDIHNMIFDYLACLDDDKGTPLLYRGCFR